MSQQNGTPEKNDVFQRIANRLFGGDRGLALILFWIGIFTVPWLSILVLVIFGIMPANQDMKQQRQERDERRRQAAETFRQYWPDSQPGQNNWQQTQDKAQAPKRPAYERRPAYSTANAPRPAPKKQAPAEPRPKPTGDAQADNLLKVGYEFLVKANDYLPEIDDLEVRAKAQTTCAKVRGIMDWVQSQPASAERAKRLTSYYLPTTQKLLSTYVSVDDTPGPNAQAICAQISRTLDTLNQALGNLMDDLLGNTALDIEAEIAAMEQMLGSEGLTDELRIPRSDG